MVYDYCSVYYCISCTSMSLHCSGSETVNKITDKYLPILNESTHNI